MADKSDVESISSTSYDESFEDAESNDENEDNIEEQQKIENLSEQEKLESFEKDMNNIPAKNSTEEELTDDYCENENDNDSEEEEIDELDRRIKNNIQISTDRPVDFNEDDYAFHLNFFRKPTNIPKFNEKKYKNGTRKSLSFSNERMREIERHNKILLSKIVSKGPSYESLNTRSKSFTKLNNIPQPTRVTSAAINRKKQQRQIDYENQILKRKIEAIAARKSRYGY